jgi:hypothetical protein
MDVLIINVPKMEPYYLPAAPAFLKGGCNYLKLTSKVIDFNLDYVEYCIDNNLRWRTLPREIKYLDTTLQTSVLQMIEKWVDTILEYDPKMLAVSIFSYYGHFFVEELLTILRNKNYNGHILLGGAGIADSLSSEPRFAKFLVSKKLADDYMESTVEAEWVDYLANFFNLGEQPKHYNSYNDHLNTPYIADYSDYRFDMYDRWKYISLEASEDISHGASEIGMFNKVILPIRSTIGCVRKCTFCEIHRKWKFSQRSSEHVIREITELVSKCDNPFIHFTDSLINGNMKEFAEIVKGLVELKRLGKNFSWGGQFIVRKKSEMSESLWQMIGMSNCSNLAIGIETGSDSLRQEMKKGFTNKDLDHNLSMMKKYNVTCVFLLFIGYPTETPDQFQETLDMFTRYQKYASTVIKNVELNYTMQVLAGTPVFEDMQEDLGLKLTWDPALWRSKKNPTLDFPERVRRRLLLQEHLQKLGFTPTVEKEAELAELLYNYRVYKRVINIVDRS